MQKRAFIFLFLISILFSFSSCGSVDIHLELALCGSYAVPGMFCADLKGGSSCEILEEDGQERILYEYTTYNNISEKEENVLVICQKIDDSYVYFYEDLCYLTPGYTAEDIDHFKNVNDWDKAIDESKLSRRTNHISFDLFIMVDSLLEHNSVREACIRATQLKSDQIKTITILDTDEHEAALYLLIGENNGKKQQFLVIVDTNYHAAAMGITDGFVSPDSIASFKRDNGWIYGY